MQPKVSMRLAVLGGFVPGDFLRFSSFCRQSEGGIFLSLGTTLPEMISKQKHLKMPFFDEMPTNINKYPP